MHFVYVLYSASKDKFYIGSSANPAERLNKHNAKHKGFTGNNSDWVIVLIEPYATKPEAEKRERQLKAWKNRERIEALVNKKSKG